MGTLRFLLAMSVVWGHVLYLRNYELIPGDTPVQAFYAISGFYMALVLDRKYRGGGAGYFLFITNRFWRLYPVYAVVLCVTLVFLLVAARSSLAVPVLTSWRSVDALDGTSAIFLLLTQLVMFGQDLYSFLALKAGSIIFWPDFHTAAQPLYALLLVPQAWTLGVELSFYLVAPFIVRRPISVMAAVLFASLALRLLLQFGLGFSGDPWSYRFFPSELAVFMLGAIGYRVYKPSVSPRKAFRILVVLAVCVAAALLINRWHGVTRFASVAALLLIFLAIPTLFRGSQDNAVDRYLGELSYPIYVCHVLVIWVIGATAQLDSAIAFLAAVSVVTFAFAAALYWFIDRPVDRWRQKRLIADRRRQSEARPEPLSLGDGTGKSRRVIGR
jgi:peptidoglycan/LPS O-acetylase OafA/YrhL